MFTFRQSINVVDFFFFTFTKCQRSLDWFRLFRKMSCIHFKMLMLVNIHAKAFCLSKSVVFNWFWYTFWVNWMLLVILSAKCSLFVGIYLIQAISNWVMCVCMACNGISVASLNSLISQFSMFLTFLFLVFVVRWGTVVSSTSLPSPALAPSSACQYPYRSYREWGRERERLNKSEFR